MLRLSPLLGVTLDAGNHFGYNALGNGMVRVIRTKAPGRHWLYLLTPVATNAPRQCCR